MGYINDARCLTKNTTPKSAKRLSPRRNNALSKYKESSMAGSDFTIFEIITLVPYKKIIVGEELFVDYRGDCLLPIIT